MENTGMTDTQRRDVETVASIMEAVPVEKRERA